MSWLGLTYFYVCAALAVLGALITIVARNPVRGVMGLLLTILSIAGLFLALHAQFLAAIQLIVYAGAVAVLFLFVIMLLGPGSTSARDRRGLTMRVIGGSLFGLASIGAALLLRDGNAPKLDSAPNGFGGIDAVGYAMFTDWLVPFELSSALLLVAAVGAVAIAKSKRPQPDTSVEASLRDPAIPSARTAGGLEPSAATATREANG
jgi:NADH-quinone oxidoreductase subunit J